jgi:hypothetical protein
LTHSASSGSSTTHRDRGGDPVALAGVPRQCDDGCADARGQLTDYGSDADTYNRHFAADVI